MQDALNQLQSFQLGSEMQSSPGDQEQKRSQKSAGQYRKNGGKPQCSPSLMKEQFTNYFMNPKYRRVVPIESDKFQLVKLMLDFGKLTEEIKSKRCGIREHFNKNCFEICGDDEDEIDIAAIELRGISEGMAESDVSVVPPQLIQSLEGPKGQNWLQHFQRDNRLVFLYRFENKNLIFSSLKDLFLLEALDTFKKRLLIGKVQTDKKILFCKS